MLAILKSLFGGGPSADFKALVKNGAIILDVRTRGEYLGGHVKGSVNIPLNELPSSAARLNKSTPVITCCASGMRSATAKNLLEEMGFAEIHNGGGWMSLNSKLR